MIQKLSFRIEPSVPARMDPIDAETIYVEIWECITSFGSLRRLKVCFDIDVLNDKFREYTGVTFRTYFHAFRNIPVVQMHIAGYYGHIQDYEIRRDKPKNVELVFDVRIPRRFRPRMHRGVEN